MNDEPKPATVYCFACLMAPHLTNEVEFAGIEEDISGADVMSFICPVHPEAGILKSRVYG